MTQMVRAIRQAPIEPGMPVPVIVIVAPPPIEKAMGTMTEKFAGGPNRALGWPLHSPPWQAK